MHDLVVAEFRSRYRAEPDFVVQAPGRVNLIGEHTDYNEGFVLPMAIDRATWIALRPRLDRLVDLFSINHNAATSFELNNLQLAKGWQEYPKGVAWALENAGYETSGWEGVTHCNVPLGAGLSSSASFELAGARAFACVSGFEWDATKMAVIGQKAENRWVGVNCGIMDQMVSAVGKEGHAVLIDCRDFSFAHIPLPEATSVVIMDTSTRRRLMESRYNDRREECRKAAQFFGVKFLRNVSQVRFGVRAHELDEVTQRRARHVITENERTLEAATAMRGNDAHRLGELMTQSHESLKRDFEVTTPELDSIVRIASAEDGCFGARMTGAGFGGCAVALVRSNATEHFVASVSERYRNETGLEPALYVCKPSEGATVVSTLHPQSHHLEPVGNV